jgi:hypothetical protein
MQDPPKFTQIWIFWFENKPSGNPGGLPLRQQDLNGRSADGSSMASPRLFQKPISPKKLLKIKPKA